MTVSQLRKVAVWRMTNSTNITTKVDGSDDGSVKTKSNKLMKEFHMTAGKS